jgi:hypothetical protein
LAQCWVSGANRWNCHERSDFRSAPWNADLNQPIAVYNNWSAYDELSDNIELTETLAMKELDQIVRLRRSGVRIDYYVLDAFWYSTNGGYREFRCQKNPEVLFAASNGFGGDTEGTFAPIRQTVDLRWLEAFDSLYCGDPRLSDVPAMNFWRSMDLYSDHMVRYYEADGVPLERIDNTGCMFGVAGTCYQRQTAAWKSMLLLEHARGGWMNVYYGNLDLIDDIKAKWFAKVQRLFFPLQAFGRTYPLGDLPGHGSPYGFCSIDARGSVYTVVNPSQSVATFKLPRVHRLQPAIVGGRILFRDAGFQPRLAADELTLGPEQLVVVGCSDYAKRQWDLGVEDDVQIPQSIRQVAVEVQPTRGTNALVASIPAPVSGDLRIVLRQSAGGKPLRSSAGAPPLGKTLGQILKLEASQGERELPVRINYDRALWSGLSWAVGEVSHTDLNPGVPVKVRCLSSERRPVELSVELYEVSH